MSESSSPIGVALEGHVATITLNRPPHNFLNHDTMAELVNALAALSKSDACRAILLRSAVKSFCAGADFAGAVQGEEAPDPAPFYEQAMRLFACTKPIVAAIGGAAIGAGLGLALACDFRVASRSARFSANFCRLGFHPGFALSLTLPRLVGAQHAARLFYTGQRIDGQEAYRMGLVDALVDDESLESTALLFSQEIAASAPLAVAATRETLRGNLAVEATAANQRELNLQRQHFKTRDFKEGVAAMAERRLPNFIGS